MKIKSKSFELKTSTGTTFCWINKLSNGNYSFHYNYEEDELTYKQLKDLINFFNHVLDDIIKE